MTDLSKVGKRGTIVIPADLRRRFGIKEGSLVITEAMDNGVLIRPAIALPADEYRTRFFAALDHGYDGLRRDAQLWTEELKERQLLAGTLMDGLDPDELWTEDGDIARAEDAG